MNTCVRIWNRLSPLRNANMRMAKHKVNLINLKKMSFDRVRRLHHCWKEQLLMVRRAHISWMTKFLLGAKLIGNTEEWFHSVPTYISFDELLRHIDGQWETDAKKTVWKQNVAVRWDICGILSQKIILANKVLIDEEIVNYVIDGIPIKSIIKANFF